MGNITKIINGNNTNQGGFVVALNRAGTSVVMSSGSATNFAQVPVYEVLESGYQTKYDDYGLRRTTVEIGDWNMDSTGSVKVNHGLEYSDTWKGTRDTAIVIRNDADTTYYDGGRTNTGAAEMAQVSVAVSGITNKKVVLIRKTSGNFDSSDFDSTSYNRGWVTVWYE